jgi:predicted dehydrogenase
MKTIRLGIIGVGQIGKRHLEAYTKVPGAQLVAASDVNAEELKRVAEQYKIESTYADFREMLKRDDIDAIDVCLHNNYHAPVANEVMRAGRHCYCEKPMAGSYVDAKSMLDTSLATGQKLSIQLSTLYTKETRIARKLVESGALGRIYHARSTGYRRRGRPFVDGYGTPTFVQKRHSAGGALYDMGVYHIARMLYLLDVPKVKRISGKIYQELDMDETRRASSGYDVEELGLGFVKFDNNLTLDIMESWAINLNKFEGSSLVGSKGGIRFDPLTFHTTISDIEMNASPEIDSTDFRWHATVENFSAYDSSQHHWVAALQGTVPLLPTAQIALETMLISEGIYLSDRLGREVSAEEVLEQSKSTVAKI